MPYNGSGTFTPYTPGNPVVTGTVISSTAFNATQNDLAAGLTNAITRDGQSPPTANLPMGGRKLTGLAAGVTAGDSLRWEQLFSQGTEQDIPSAATTDIGSLNTTNVRITGTTTITSFGTNYNGPRFVRFAGVLTLTHNATTLILPGGANITTAAGDRAILTPVGNPGSGWQVLVYERADGTPVTITPIGSGGTGQTTGALAIAALFGTRVDVASAATVDLTSVVSSINITGTTTITGFTVAAGRLIFVRFNAALTLTNNANIVTQAGANITTAAGDTCILRATAANVVEVLFYTRAYSGTAPIRAYQGNLSGAAIRELTGIPSWARKIVVQYWAASTNGATSIPGVEIGPSGYTGTGSVTVIQSVNAANPAGGTVGVPFALLAGSGWTASTVAYGRAEFEFVGSTGSAERWIATLTGNRTDTGAVVSATADISFSAGTVVDRVRMNTRSADQWDAGEWSVAIYA